MNPWLGIAALAAVAQFVFGYTFLTFYTVTGFVGQQRPDGLGRMASNTPHQ